MTVATIVEKVVELDLLIRGELRLQGISIGEREALELLRNSVQESLTRLLRYQE